MFCRSHLVWSLSLLWLTLVGPLAAQTAAPKLEFQKGDHVSIIGNTLADRMQHEGWMETLIHSRFPELQLVFRNLSFSADEIDKRPRSDNFGSPEQWLTDSKTDIVFAFFGYNEAFAGEAGLPAFRNKLGSFIDSTLKADYKGKASPKLVLFSPIAHQNLKSPVLPSGEEHNVLLGAYSKAMGEVAKEKGIVFVDLFTPTQELFAKTSEPLTMNGVHLNSLGDQNVALIIDQALFGAPKSQNLSPLEPLRSAVNEKNFFFFNRYRTVDAYNVFGGRSKLAWGGQSNADVMSREMEIFNVMAQNRDQRVWAVANGKDLKVDDSNTPPEVPVKTNKPGPLEDGKYPFLSGVEGISKMQIHKGLEVNLFASEEQFPDLANPVQMSVDTDGRVWVATWPSYPHWNPKEPMLDKLVILPDDNGDGKADRCVVFADNLNSVTGFEFWGGGVLVAAAPEIWFMKDTDGDDKADVKIRMLQGISAEDTHHTANALVIGPDGGLYFSHGVFHVDNSETPTKTFRSTQSGVFRFDPRTYEVDFHFPIGPNPHGDVIDQWGYQFASDGTGGTGNYINIGKGVGAPKQWYQKRVRPVPATGILSSSHFPPEYNGNFLICNAIGFLGVLNHRVEYTGADINAIEEEPILVSDDPNFRPTDLEIGGDGALYVSDWCNPIIGHMQHNMRDPSRDHTHGRVYRVTAQGRPLLKPAKMKGKPINEVLANFYAKENGTRYRARLELSGRDTKEATAAVSQWAAKIEPNTPENEQALLEGLWVFEEHRVPNEELLKKVLLAKEPKVRAAAIRTLGHWGAKIAGWEPILVEAARDAEPLVRAEAVKAAVSFEGIAAAEAIFEASTRPTDVQLTHVLSYAKGKINVDAIVQESIKSGKPLSPAAKKYALSNANVAELLKMERTPEVYDAILSRNNASSEVLRESLTGLAKARNGNEIELLLSLIGERETAPEPGNLGVLANLLAQRSSAELKPIQAKLEKMAKSSKSDIVSQAAYAAWIVAENSADDAFIEASKSEDSLQDLLKAIPQIPSAELRGSLYARVRELMFELPAHLSKEQKNIIASQRGLMVEFYQPHPSDVSLETLAKLKPKASGSATDISLKVPVRTGGDQFGLKFTGSLQIDQPGKYTFFLSSDDGSRLYIDGKLAINHDSNHGMDEKKGDVQLTAGLHPIVVTYYNSGGGEGLQLAYSGPKVKKQNVPAAKLTSAGGSGLSDVAIQVLNSIPGHEAEKFLDLTKIIIAGNNRDAAIQAIRKLDKKSWDKNQARSLADNLVAYLSDVPASERTAPEATEAMALAKDLAGLLTADQASAINSRLQNLDVRVIAIGTQPHRMVYDKERIFVAAGKPVEFRFSNTDSMPHNFAIVAPGSMEAIGNSAEASARDPDAAARHFIPKSDKVLLGSRLLQPGESQSLSFEAPKQPGIYPYVCTYPGHWRRMYGALYVVADLNAYQANPQSYLAANPMEIKDELLKLLDQNHDWKVAELLDSVKALENGRSFEVGQNAFKMAACFSCHKIGEEGQPIGPDLTKLDPMKQNLEHILRSMVTPSEKIDEKFQSYVFHLHSGKILTGMVLEENGDTLKITENPLAKTAPIVIKKSDIEERTKSAKSIMPEGLMNKLTREEVLDLISFIYSRGDKKHALFQAGHH